MSEKPLLSIIVPVFNGQSYLLECLRSIQAQTFTSFECLLIDDGSTDNSFKICEDISKSDERFRAICKENGGPMSARIEGIKIAKGDFLAFVDSDDIVGQDMFYYLMSVFQGNCSEEIDIGVCDFQTFSNQPNFTQIRNVSFRLMESIDGLAKMVNEDGFNWSLWGKVYRKCFFIKYSDLDNCPSSFGEDSFINWKLFKFARKVAYWDYDGYFYRVHLESLMHRKFSTDYFVYLNTWLKMYEESFSLNNPKIQEGILNWFSKEGLHIVWQARHIELSTDELERLNGYCKKIAQILQEGGELFPYQKKFIRWLTDDAVMLKSLMSEEIEPIKRFQNEHPSLWVYGMGDVSKDVMLMLSYFNVSVEGYVVTKYDSKRDRENQNLTIHTLCDFLHSSNDNAGVLLSLNRANSREVKQLLIENDYSENDYINVGNCSYRYYL